MDQISRAEELEQKRSYWKQHIDSWQVTGQTQAEYCRRHNLKHHRGSDHAIILLFKRNSTNNTHFDALEPHFHAPKCPCKALAILLTRNTHLFQPICDL